MAERPRNFQQVLAESVAKAIADYQVKRQEKLDDEASVARQQMVMQQQEQERQLKIAERQKQMQALDMQIRQHMIEMSMTPEQRLRVQKDLELRNAKELEDMRATHAREKEQQDNVQRLNAIRQYLQSLQGQNVSLKGQQAAQDRAWQSQKAAYDKQYAIDKLINPDAPYAPPERQPSVTLNDIPKEITNMGMLYGLDVSPLLKELSAPALAPAAQIGQAQAFKTNAQVPPMPATWRGTQDQWLDYLRKKGMLK